MYKVVASAGMWHIFEYDFDFKYQNDPTVEELPFHVDPDE